MKKKILMTESKWKNCNLDAETIAFYRRNPCIAAEQILGVSLLDSQKYILQSSWQSSNCCWACSRNFGKSFLIAIMAILKAVLYENQNIYIVSSVGSQSRETFLKMEELILRRGRTSESIDSLKDIVEKEIVVNPANKDGFKHSPESYSTSMYNGSSIYTLNSNPDHIRGKRANIIFFDEAAFCSEEILAVAKAFTAQDTNFRTSTEDSYDPRKRPKQIPTQIIYASSQDTMDTIFYKNYKDFAKRMIAGDRDFFVCDMPCTTAMQVYMKGIPYPPLLSQSVVDSAMQENPEKARREYYNIPTMDGGQNQIVKWATIRRNEKLIIPHATWKPENKIILAFDPARTNDNSILSAMQVYEDPDYGTCGDIINCVNFVDTASKKKYKLDSNRQVDLLRQYLLAYNGDNPDYEYIDGLYVDSGSGGGGISAYADTLLNNFLGVDGKNHRGLIDKTHDIYSGYSKIYRDAVDKIRLVDPRKYRTQMVEEMIELMNLGVIRFPMEYSGQDFLRIPKDDKALAKRGGSGDEQEEEMEVYYLSQDEKISLTQIDLMKQEITSIYKISNPENTSVRYALPKEKENKMHDDRFYTCLLLSHRLYELRRAKAVRQRRKPESKIGAFQIRAPKIR